MEPLHARIPPYIPATLQLASRWQEIILTFTHTLSTSVTCARSAVETVWVIKHSFLAWSASQRTSNLSNVASV